MSWHLSLLSRHRSRVAVRERQVSESLLEHASLRLTESVCVCAVETVCCVPQRPRRHVVSVALCELLLAAPAGEKILPDLLSSV